jgi:hypothetical protein
MKNKTSETQNKTSENSSDQPEKSETIATVKETLQKMEDKDAYWKNIASNIYEAKLKLTDPTFVQINHVRQAIRYYLIPLLKKVLKEPEDKQKYFLKYYSFIFSEERMSQFFKHFYAVNETDDLEELFKKRDPFEQDALILYDLYKAKRTITGIKKFIKVLTTQRFVFPSVYNKSQQIDILKCVNSILFVAFKQSLKPEFQVEIFRNISLEYLRTEKIDERRKLGLIYSKVEKPEGSPFRRIFLFILFRNHIRTVINKDVVNIHYNLVEFEHLVKEYFDCFLDDSNHHNDVLQLYLSLHIQSKTLTESIIEDPDPANIVYEEIENIKTYL